MSYTCPNTTSLELVSLFGGSAPATITFLQSLRHDTLPHLIELRAGCLPDNEVIELNLSTAECAEYFPPGLCKLALPGVAIHHKLLQYLVSMPGLVELEAFSLCRLGAMGPFLKVQSDACAWQVLRLR